MIPIDSALLDEIVSSLEALARKSTNGEAATYARLAGDLSAAVARYASATRISPPAPPSSRTPLAPEEREV